MDSNTFGQPAGRAAGQAADRALGRGAGRAPGRPDLPDRGHQALTSGQLSDDRRGGQRRADALAELARRGLEGGRLPQTGGVRPQLTVIVDLESLQHHPGPAALGGEVGGLGPLAPAACRRLACDAAVTRVLVTRQPHPGGQGPEGHGHHHTSGQDHPRSDPGLAGRLQAALAWLPPLLGGAPSRWMWAGPAGSSPQPNAPPWPGATAAGCSPTAPGPWPGGRPISCGPGWTAAPPTWPTWPCRAARIIGPCTRGAGGCAEDPTGG